MLYATNIWVYVLTTRCCGSGVADLPLSFLLFPGEPLPSVAAAGVGGGGGSYASGSYFFPLVGSPDPPVQTGKGMIHCCTNAYI